MSYTNDFEAACRTFFAHLVAELDQQSDRITGYAFFVEARGQTTKDVAVSFQLNLTSQYMNSDSPRGGNIRAILQEAARRKGWEERTTPLKIAAAKPESFDLDAYLNESPS